MLCLSSDFSQEIFNEYLVNWWEVCLCGCECVGGGQKASGPFHLQPAEQSAAGKRRWHFTALTDWEAELVAGFTVLWRLYRGCAETWSRRNRLKKQHSFWYGTMEGRKRSLEGERWCWWPSTSSPSGPQGCRELYFGHKTFRVPRKYLNCEWNRPSASTAP